MTNLTMISFFSLIFICDNLISPELFFYGCFDFHIVENRFPDFGIIAVTIKVYISKSNLIAFIAVYAIDNDISIFFNFILSTPACNYRVNFGPPLKHLIKIYIETNI